MQENMKKILETLTEEELRAVYIFALHIKKPT